MHKYEDSKLGPSYKIEDAAFAFLGLGDLTWYNVFHFGPFICQYNNSFSLELNKIPSWMFNTFFTICSSVEGHRGCFHAFVMSRTVMNMDRWVSVGASIAGY